MKHYIFQRFVCSILISLLCVGNISIAQTTNTAANCNPRGFTVALFNGVLTSLDDAILNLNEMQKLIGSTHMSADNREAEPITYRLMYNRSGKSSGGFYWYENTWWHDFVETFRARSKEINDIVKPRNPDVPLFDLMWDAAQGVLDPNSPIASITPLDPIIQDLSKAAVRVMVQALVDSKATPPTAGDYAIHDATLKSALLSGQKVLLIAHSQGNLFMNHAYDNALKVVAPNGIKVTDQNVKAMYIAPASADTSHGPHRLADLDVVINSLRATGPVAANNVTMPLSRKDLTGHNLINTYLDPDRPAREEIVRDIRTLLNTVVSPLIGDVSCKSQFWQATYSVDFSKCDTPNYALGGNACATAIQLYGGTDYPKRFYFKTGPTEPFNMRFDDGVYSFGFCTGQTVPDLSVADSFTRPINLTGLFFNDEERRDVTYLVTSRSAGKISGTFSYRFNYPIPTRPGYPYAPALTLLQGTWEATPRSTSFPKCVYDTSTADRCTQVGRAAPAGGGFNQDCDWKTVDNVGRPGEWTSLPK